MIFDLFHSISDPVIDGKRLGAKKTFEQYLAQAQLAEDLGFDTLWLAESHFSSETQKKTSVATIPHFHGEVGLNSDSFQLVHWLAQKTKRVALGTGIHNIVGGSGGPIASADRLNFLSFVNQTHWHRTLRWGVAAGRFPYQNTPFGLVPRDEFEKAFWPIVTRAAFLEALEIFLRLLKGETLSSRDTKSYQVEESDLVAYGDKATALRTQFTFPHPIEKRWQFEALNLVPEPSSHEGLHIVLGSADPKARDVGVPLWDLDLFNLSFTPPEKLQLLHNEMQRRCTEHNRQWNRGRLPRTVMVFIDPDPRKAQALANEVLDTYIEAMRGTAQVPDKKVLMERALIGDASAVRDQLDPENPRGFHGDDRLMLWFEFNQCDGETIRKRMRYFMEEVASKI